MVLEGHNPIISGGAKLDADNFLVYSCSNTGEQSMGSYSKAEARKMEK
jgi:hypothetical protein